MRCKYWSEEVAEICKLVGILYDDMGEGAECVIEREDDEWCL